MEFHASVPAKINLYLRVFGRRSDGFHEMETLMLKVGFFDRLSLVIEEGDGFDLQIVGAPNLETRGNLVERACKAYLAAAGQRRKIRGLLEKNIFMGAGLGGGSSDAAYALRLMHDALGVVDSKNLMRIAGELGSDVPFFMIEDTLAFASGRGEKLLPMGSLPPRSLVLVNPGIHVPTKDAYAWLNRSSWIEDSSPTIIKHAIDAKDWRTLERAIPFENDFEPVVESRFPEIAKVRGLLLSQGATMSRMTGSGSSVFGVFEDVARAKASLDSMKKYGFRAVFVRSL